MVLRGKSFHRMEVQVKHILAVDSREACVPLFRRIIPDTDRFESLQRAQGRASFGSLSFVGLAQQLTLPISSAIIQDIMALREAGQAAVAYFYFDFRDTDKQNLRNALPSLLTQLSARSDHCCDLLSRVYKAHDDGALKPNSSTMITCLNEMLTLPNQGPIYIILDALDECPNTSGIPSARKQVLNLIKDLVGLRLSNLHLCVTSRPEIDIRAMLEPLAFRPVSIHEQSGQKRDIEEYIRFVVRADSDTAMRRWREQDKVLVIETLTDRADGM
jgi:hypothetical protein